MAEADLLVSGLKAANFCQLTVFRPKEFAKKPTYLEDSEEEESTVGKMPPS